MYNFLNAPNKAGHRRDASISRIPVSRSTPTIHVDRRIPKDNGPRIGSTPRWSNDWEDDASEHTQADLEHEECSQGCARKDPPVQYAPNSVFSDAIESSMPGHLERKRRAAFSSNTSLARNTPSEASSAATTILRQPPTYASRVSSGISLPGRTAALPRSRTHGTIDELSAYAPSPRARQIEEEEDADVTPRPRQPSPRQSLDDGRIYEAHSSTWWAGRFAGLRDRFMDDLLQPENMKVVIAAHSSTGRAKMLQSAASSAPLASAGPSLRELTRSLPPAYAFDSDYASLTEADPAAFSRRPASQAMQDLQAKKAHEALQKKADHLLDDNTRYWRIFAHLDGLCATEEARTSLIEFQNEFPSPNTSPKKKAPPARKPMGTDGGMGDKQSRKHILSGDIGFVSRLLNSDGGKPHVKSSMLRRVATAGSVAVRGKGTGKTDQASMY